MLQGKHSRFSYILTNKLKRNNDFHMLRNRHIQELYSGGKKFAYNSRKNKFYFEVLGIRLKTNKEFFEQQFIIN